MVKTLKSNENSKTGVFRLAEEQKKVYYLLDNNEDVKLSILNGFKEKIEKTSYRFLDVDEQGNQPFKEWTSYLIKNKINSKRKVDEVKNVRKFDDITLPVDLCDLFTESFANSAELYKGLLSKIANKLPINIYFDIDKNNFTFEVVYEGCDYLWQNKNNTWHLLRLSKKDLPLSISNLKSKDSILMFCYLLGEEGLVSDDDFYEIIKKLIKKSIERFSLDFSSAKIDDRELFCEMESQNIPAVFLDKSIIKKNLLKDLSSKNFYYQKDRAAKFSSKKIQNSHVKDSFESILNVDDLVKGFSKFGNADVVNLIADSDYVSGYSNLTKEEQAGLRRNWIDKGYSYDVPLEVLEELYSPDVLSDLVLNHYNSVIFPGGSGDNTQKTLFNLEESKKKIETTELLKDKLIEKFESIKELNCTLETLVDIVNFINFENVFITNTTTLVLFAKNILGCESLETINVLIDDSSIAGYNFDNRNGISSETKQSNLYSKIKQVASFRKLDGISLNFVDQTTDCLVKKYSSKFSNFLGDIQLLTEEDVLLNESYYSVEIKAKGIYYRSKVDFIPVIFTQK